MNNDYSKEWYALLEKANSEGITSYMLGKALFKDNYRKIYRSNLVVSYAMYEKLVQAYKEQSENSLLRMLQDVEEEVFDTPEEVRSKQIDGEIGMEFKPFVFDEESEKDMKVLPPRNKPYTELQLNIAAMVNDNKTNQEIYHKTKAPGSSIAYIRNIMIDEEELPNITKPIVVHRKRNKKDKDTEKGKPSRKKVSLKGGFFQKGCILKDKKSYSEKMHGLIKTVNEKINEENVLIDPVIEKYGVSYGMIVRAFPEHLLLKDGKRYLDEVQSDIPMPVEITESETTEKVDESVKDNLGTTASDKKDTVEELAESLKEPVSESVISEKSVENETYDEFLLEDKKEIEGTFVGYEKFNTYVTPSKDFDLEEWLAPICYEPPQDKPFPAPVKPIVPMFERLGEQILAVGDTVYRLNIKFDVMDGPRSVNLGSSLMLCDVRNGNPFKYILTVAQFNRFKDSQLAAHWFATRIPRELYKG